MSVSKELKYELESFKESFEYIYANEELEEVLSNRENEAIETINEALKRLT